MTARVTCEVCGHEHLVERQIWAPEVFHIICHSCESVLDVTVTNEDIDAFRSDRPTAFERLRAHGWAPAWRR